MTVIEAQATASGPRRPSRAMFDKAYDAEILDRTFVEDLQYYHASRTRFWHAFLRISELDLPPGSVAVDIGGGIMGVLMDRLLGFDVIVADVTDEARADIERLGLRFVNIDLFRDLDPPTTGADLVVLQEVIEHIPQPPYLVLRRIAQMLRSGGRLFLTTPNGHRFRNLLYMVLGREILGIYRYPEEGGEALGHQHEYTRKQMIWQAEHAGYTAERAEYYQDGWTGASIKARIAWWVTAPVGLIGYMRNGISMTLRYTEPAKAETEAPRC